MFSRIIESPLYGQILLIKDYDSEDDMDTIRFLVKPSNLGVCEACLKFKTEEKRDSVFDVATQEQAEKLVESIFDTNNLLED